MPKLRDEDRAHALALGRVLKELRDRAGMTREEAETYLGVPLSTLGKWERGDNAPKGYDLGQLYLKYKKYGADPEWLLNPPISITVDPVKEAKDWTVALTLGTP